MTFLMNKNPQERAQTGLTVAKNDSNFLKSFGKNLYNHIRC